MPNDSRAPSVKAKPDHGNARKGTQGWTGTRWTNTAFGTRTPTHAHHGLEPTHTTPQLCTSTLSTCGTITDNRGRGSAPTSPGALSFNNGRRIGRRSSVKLGVPTPSHAGHSNPPPPQTKHTTKHPLTPVSPRVAQNRAHANGGRKAQRADGIRGRELQPTNR
jgi:hypothetical protein